jgi:predicted transcriptional regulator
MVIIELVKEAIVCLKTLSGTKVAFLEEHMNIDVKEGVKRAIVKLYKQNKHAARLFDLNAERTRDASYTSVDAIAWKLEINRWEAVALARQLEEAGCGQFKNGRRGSKSRFEWAYSCILLGKAAAGEQVQLEEPEDPQEDEEKPTDGVSGMTIAEAKSAIASRLGISTSQIEIIIKA